MKVFPLLLAAASVGALSTPLQTTFDSEEVESTLDWERAPSPDATGHLIFNSVSSVLQRWPNTIKRPGHSFVPATMPAGTIVYHGRGSAEVPTKPEWLAFDFEHAYIFARGQQGHVLTFATTRALKLIYLDGASAAKIDDGALDTQDLIMYREVKGGEGHERGGMGEHERIEKLCQWGKPLGVDGFVRMEFHFEVMYCDFSDGVELVSALQILPQGGHGGPGGPGGPPGPGGPGGPGRPERLSEDTSEEELLHHRPFFDGDEEEEDHHHHHPHRHAEDVQDRHHPSHGYSKGSEHSCEHQSQDEHASRHHRHHRPSFFEFVAHKLGLDRFIFHRRPGHNNRLHAHEEHGQPSSHHGAVKLSFESEKFIAEHAHHHHGHPVDAGYPEHDEPPHRPHHGKDGVDAHHEQGHSMKFKADRLDGPRFSSSEHTHRHHEYQGQEHRPDSDELDNSRRQSAHRRPNSDDGSKFGRPSRRPSDFPHPPSPPHDASAANPLDEPQNSQDSGDMVQLSDEPSRRGPGGPGGPGRGEPATPPAGWKGSLPSAGFSEARVAGKWHDAAPGETRVRPDFTGFVSLYDPALQSLVEARRGLPHIRHRIKGISVADADAKMKELEEVLTRTSGATSGVDWASVTRVVIERYSQRLELLSHTLRSAKYDVLEKAASVRAQLLTMLVLYFTVDDVPSEDGSRAWLAPVVQRCTTTQLRAIPTTLLTPQEQLIHNAVGETLREICRRLAIMFDAAYDVETATLEVAVQKLVVVERETSELMAWLDWSVWVKCRPACAIEEMCVVPTWPFGRDEDPFDMTPKCVRMSSV
ncbi:unnamed protein product [Peniophora sp. CBMAI 1063]|nr:unnamed protein product [Peniophora sp. CBMAI 1063]